MDCVGSSSPHTRPYTCDVCRHKISERFCTCNNDAGRCRVSLPSYVAPPKTKKTSAAYGAINGRYLGGNVSRIAANLFIASSPNCTSNGRATSAALGAMAFGAVCTTNSATAPFLKLPAYVWCVCWCEQEFVLTGHTCQHSGVAAHWCFVQPVYRQTMFATRRIATLVVRTNDALPTTW